MKILIYPLISTGFCAFLFAQEHEEIYAFECVLYPPNTSIVIDWFPPVISMKMDQENWSTDIFLERKDDSGDYPSFINTCVRVAASGNQIKILGYYNPLCGFSTPFHTSKLTVNNDKVIHLIIQGAYSSHLLLRLLGYDTQVASIPLDVTGGTKLISSTQIELDCYKGCSLLYGRDGDNAVTDNPIAIYGLKSPLNLTLKLRMSHDGLNEYRNIVHPFPLKKDTWYRVEVKETPNEVIFTINDKGKRRQVFEGKLFSLEETILKIQGDDFLYTDPKCTFKDQENKDNKDGDDDGDDDGVAATTTTTTSTADDTDVNDEGDHATSNDNVNDEGDHATADDNVNDDGNSDDGDDRVATTIATTDDFVDDDGATTSDDGDDEEKPKQTHSIFIDMTLKMLLNVTLTLV